MLVNTTCPSERLAIKPTPISILPWSVIHSGVTLRLRRRLLHPSMHHKWKRLLFFIESFPQMCFGPRRDPFWRSISRDTNVEVSALSPKDCYEYPRVSLQPTGRTHEYEMLYSLLKGPNMCGTFAEVDRVSR